MSEEPLQRRQGIDRVQPEAERHQAGAEAGQARYEAGDKRAVATHYDKRDDNYLASIKLASVRVLLKSNEFGGLAGAPRRSLHRRPGRPALSCNRSIEIEFADEPSFW